MSLEHIWKAAEYIRNDDEEIIAVRLPVEAWRELMDRVQALEDREAARQRLARLRGQTTTPDESDDAAPGR